MRKITRLAALAFRDHRNFTLGNTSVTFDKATGIIQMRLHGNLIAERCTRHKHGLSSVGITLAGWPTPTTRERVNGLLEMLGAQASVYQHKHEQRLAQVGNHPVIDSNTWYTIATRC